ncbi:hypothetical protein [Roseicella sp. DB1501]|uniref:hypothetical protein n=1 Tax=Roseicella sp. DB1501 TaxID=2730925 RepID=UPI0014918690|nr:hypothetical protein [Roseicella sp. DB1501]NOG70442.1 hypothetical protein [Roseicella sp. DB1501]
MARALKEPEIIKLLKKATVDAGGVRAFARNHSFAAGFVSNVLNGREPMTDRLAECLGFQRETVTRFTPRPEAV